METTRPVLLLHCGSDDCGGDRYFDFQNETGGIYSSRKLHKIMFEYNCRHCGKSPKTFAFFASALHNDFSGDVIKLGEWPVFGPPTHPKLVSLVGPDRELFFMGKRAESAGLGIGAFTYYRRVVENQKNWLIDAIIAVAERVQCGDEMIGRLRDAKGQPQFSTAVDRIKDAIPQALLVNGHSPLSLLHGALSRGIHAETDQECMEMAATIRLVLGELAERMSTALKEHKELQAALTKLMNPTKPEKQRANKASDATSEPAPGAASSVHQG